MFNLFNLFNGLVQIVIKFLLSMSARKRPRPRGASAKAMPLDDLQRLYDEEVEASGHERWLNAYAYAVRQLDEATAGTWNGHTKDCEFVRKVSTKAKGLATALADDASENERAVPLLVNRINNIGAAATKSVANVCAYINTVRMDEKIKVNDGEAVAYIHELVGDKSEKDDDDEDEEEEEEGGNGNNARNIANAMKTVFKPLLQEVVKSNEQLTEANVALASAITTFASSLETLTAALKENGNAERSKDSDKEET